MAHTSPKLNSIYKGAAALIILVICGLFVLFQKPVGKKIDIPQATVTGFPSPIQVTGAVGEPKSNEDWKNVLTPLQYNILREAGTEVPFTSDLLHEKRKGTYVTADCNEPVFRSEQKFDSGTGWPSFWAPIHDKSIITKEDDSLGEIRTEVLGAKCGGHLGHVFNDGHPPTGLRYCMNGAALKFIPDKDQ